MDNYRIKIAFQGTAKQRKSLIRRIGKLRIDKVIVSQAKRRIDRGGDSEIRYKRLWADTYRTRTHSAKSRILPSGNITSDEIEVGKAERSIASAHKRMTKANKAGQTEGFNVLFPVGKKDKKTSHAIRHSAAAKSLDRAQKKLDSLGGASGKSYRAGGKPLLDTRAHVYMTLNSGPPVMTANGAKFTLRGSLAAAFHHHGFKTNGPNFIPLTLHARRTHRPGADPRHEGLIEGQDYIMMWKGVKVPARPIFRFAPEDKRDIAKTIMLKLGKRKRRAA